MTNTFKEFEFDENSNIKPPKKIIPIINMSIRHLSNSYDVHSTNPFFVVVMIANSPT